MSSKKGDFLKLNSKRVLQILYKNYRPRLAILLHSTWIQLVLKGEQTVKNSMSKSTFFRHKKKLLEVDCIWPDMIHHLAQ